MSEKIRILLIDDHTLFRSGIKALLARQTDCEVVGEAADGLSGLKLIEQKRNIGIEMTAMSILVIMLWTEHPTILKGKIKRQTCPMTKNTVMEIQRNPKAR